MSTLTHRKPSTSTKQNSEDVNETPTLTRRKQSSPSKTNPTDNPQPNQTEVKQPESPQQRRRSLTKDRFPVNPYIAWPTVFLGIFALCLWIGSLICMLSHRLPRFFCVIISTIAAFLSFTPVHDASHRAIGCRDSFAFLVNEVMGRLCVLPLLFPFAAFRYMHHLHHRYTNIPELDPDYFSQRGFFYCILGEFKYYLYLLTPSNFRHVPAVVLGETLLDLICIVAGLTYWVRNFGLENVFWGVILPQRLASFYLLYTFDRVPHKGTKVDPKHLTTKHINGFFSSNNSDNDDDKYNKNKSWKSFFLRLVLMNQDAHAIHHQYPVVPFYNYHIVWNLKKDQLYKMGVQNTSLFRQD